MSLPHRDRDRELAPLHTAGFTSPHAHAHALAHAGPSHPHAHQSLAHSLSPLSPVRFRDSHLPLRHDEPSMARSTHSDMDVEDSNTIAPSEADEYDELDEEHEREMERRAYERQRRRERYQSTTLEIDADDPYFLNHETYRPNSTGSGSASGSAGVSASWRTAGTYTPGGGEVMSSIGADRRVRPASRRNVSRACEQCRGRKSKCSGESKVSQAHGYVFTEEWVPITVTHHWTSCNATIRPLTPTFLTCANHLQGRHHVHCARVWARNASTRRSPTVV